MSDYFLVHVVILKEYRLVVIGFYSERSHLGQAAPIKGIQCFKYFKSFKGCLFLKIYNYSFNERRKQTMYLITAADLFFKITN